MLKPEPGQALCFECASGGHELYEIVGLQKEISKSHCKFLNKLDGFNESCPLVVLVNCWCDSLVDKCASNSEKADKLEELLRRVLKEFYCKRYLQRGQLISQVYHTVYSE